MSVPDKPLLALLQWVGGEYNNTYTAGIPTEWIKDFNPETFNPNEEEDISYVVEWRENKKNKKPKNGWKCYDARVINISRNLKFLENRIEILEGLVSPLRPTRTLETIKNNLKYSLKRNFEGQFSSTEEGDPDPEQAWPSGYQKKKRKKSKAYNPLNDSFNDLRNEGEQDGGKKVHQQLSEDEGNVEEAISNQQIHCDNQFIKQTLNTLVNEIRGLKESQAEMIQAQVNNQNPQQNDNDLVEIGHAGSNVFVQHQQWLTANSRDTFQGMGLSLVRALFEDEILIRSNLKGGVSKINKNAPRRSGLDANIMAAIKETVKQKFPAEFKQTLFGMAINNMMNDLRSKNLVANNIQDDEEND